MYFKNLAANAARSLTSEHFVIGLTFFNKVHGLRECNKNIKKL